MSFFCQFYGKVFINFHNLPKIKHTTFSLNFSIKVWYIFFCFRVSI